MQGEYSLSVSKKDGWSVAPESVNVTNQMHTKGLNNNQVSLNEEGVVLGCENKVEFEVTGFRIHGHTHSIRSEAATSGIEISLISADNHVIQSVVTDEQGYYTMENVMSGDYTLKAFHPSWVIAEPSSQSISVIFILIYNKVN